MDAIAVPRPAIPEPLLFAIRAVLLRHAVAGAMASAGVWSWVSKVPIEKATGVAADLVALGNEIQPELRGAGR
jgi:hypothetical protein